MQLRNADMHDYHLQGVKVNPKNTGVYGVCKCCAFADVLHARDVLQLFPHDIMHDVLEGVVPVTVQLVLHHFAYEASPNNPNCVSLSDLNSAIDSCTLSNPTNRPNHLTQLSLRSKIGGSASHKFELFLMLPRILASLVDLSLSANVWNVYLLLREVCDLLFAPILQRDQVAGLKRLIAQFLAAFMDVFGINKITPKFRYMIHYPHQITRTGPLRNVWCMHFESKHQYFKKLAVISNNHKNLTFTLAKRHQMKLYWELCSTDSLDSQAIERTCKMHRFSDLPGDLQTVILNIANVFIDSDEQVAAVKIHRHDNCKPVCGKVYVADVVGEEMVPVFCLVKYIRCVHSMWMLCGRLLFPDYFERKYHAFCVQINGDWSVARPQYLHDYSAVDFFQLENRLYVSMRTQL